MSHALNNLTVTIEKLISYPVKSFAGIEYDSCQANTSGLEHDRQWAVVKANGQVLTQRQEPHMALIQPSLRPSTLPPSRKQENTLFLALKEYGEIEVSLPQTPNVMENIAVWKDNCTGLVADDKINQWLTRVLNSAEPLFLVQTKHGSLRNIENQERFNIDLNTYADAAPYLVANTASLEALNLSLRNEGLPETDMRFFRPNIVISGLPAFSEHKIGRLTPTLENNRNNDFFIDMIDHCSRCSMINVNPDTGERFGKQGALGTLTTLNTMPNQPKAPAFGVNAVIRKNESNMPVNLNIGQTFYLS